MQEPTLNNGDEMTDWILEGVQEELTNMFHTETRQIWPNLRVNGNFYYLESTLTGKERTLRVIVRLNDKNGKIIGNYTWDTSSITDNQYTNADWLRTLVKKYCDTVIDWGV